MTRINATTRVLALVGDPIEHSLSPDMYGAAITALGFDAAYVALRADAGALPHVIRAFEAVGIAGNVTVPHKIAVAQLLIRLTPLAKEIGSVNTFWPDGGRLIGDNTDVPGVLDALEQLEASGPWLVVGTGGAARAVAAAARTREVTLLVRSRGADRARTFVGWARSLGVDALVDDGRAIHTVINATPLGLQRNDNVPVPHERLAGCHAVLDLVYAPGETRWVRECRAQRLRAADGRQMLVAQGVRAFERFFPDAVAPRDVMAAAVDRALAR